MSRSSSAESTPGPMPMFVNVALPLPLDQLYSYRVPEHLQQQVHVGTRVLVPFGTRQQEGVIVESMITPDVSQVKDIHDCLDNGPFFHEHLLELTRWMARYYLASWGLALKCAIPAGINIISRRVVSATQEVTPAHVEDISKRAPLQAEILRLVLNQPTSVNQLRRKLRGRSPYAALAACESRGWLRIEDQVKDAAGPKTALGVRLAVSIEEAKQQLPILDRRAPKQAAVMRVLLSDGNADEPMLLGVAAERAETGTTTVRALEKKSLVVCEPITLVRDPVPTESSEASDPLPLNPDQRTAFEQIIASFDAQDSGVFLLHGVTGSGKTEVYMQAMAHVLQHDRTAIVLVPEISLTPQTVARFSARFGDRITVLHSQLSQGERYDQWCRAKSGEVDIVVGPRSALFAPLSNLGLIIIDEEHETTYKQDDPAPRYHARDVAIKRAELAQATVVLGTATPSLESYHLSKQGTYRLLTLPTRVNHVPMPPVTVVDMREELKAGNRTIFSTPLKEAIEIRLERREQTMLFLNRRGHSTYVFCRECGYVERCEDCSITMTYHFNAQKLVCHHCNAERPTSKSCPGCRGGFIRYFGLGTQQVEEEVIKAFPGARIARMDTDSTTRKNAHQKILAAFREGELDLLIGTQMIAKGLDFPRVTLVGVIIADTALHLPDFRSGERSFNLLTQVAGRAGRGEAGGEVIVQSYQPDHYSIQAASKHDYGLFYEQEIVQRQALGYPPIAHALSILVHGEAEDSVQQACYTLEAILLKLREGAFQQVDVLGPAPAPLTRIRKRYRWHFLLKSHEISHLRAITQQMMAEAPPTITRGDVNVVLNMDPMTVL